jgi:hypothetical protein
MNILKNWDFNEADYEDGGLQWRDVVYFHKQLTKLDKPGASISRKLCPNKEVSKSI